MLGNAASHGSPLSFGLIGFDRLMCRVIAGQRDPYEPYGVRDGTRDGTGPATAPPFFIDSPNRPTRVQTSAVVKMLDIAQIGCPSDSVRGDTPPTNGLIVHHAERRDGMGRLWVPRVENPVVMGGPPTLRAPRLPSRTGGMEASRFESQIRYATSQLVDKKHRLQNGATAARPPRASSRCRRPPPPESDRPWQAARLPLPARIPQRAAHR